MSIPLPTILYKVPGPHFSDVRVDGKLVTYNYAGAKTEEQLEKLLDEGWSPSIQDAAVKYADYAKYKKTNLQREVDEQDSFKLTREELEREATRFNIKFDGRTSDRLLRQMVNQAGLLETISDVDDYIAKKPGESDRLSSPTPTKLDPLFKAASYAAISRAELESQADELGLQYDGRTSDRKLMQLIADAKGG